MGLFNVSHEITSKFKHTLERGGCREIECIGKIDEITQIDSFDRYSAGRPIELYGPEKVYYLRRLKWALNLPFNRPKSENLGLFLIESKSFISALN